MTDRTKEAGLVKYKYTLPFLTIDTNVTHTLNYVKVYYVAIQSKMHIRLHEDVWSPNPLLN